MKWVRTPNWIKWAFPQLVWDVPTDTKKIYLTFDDGPTPGVTPQVLALLVKYNAKATFFCLGAKAKEHTEIMAEIRAAGHSVGNHGYQHLSGFLTSYRKYIENVRLGEQFAGSKLFRPPYGRITPRQIHRLRKDHKIIMWSVMSMDFDRQVSPEQCFRNVIDNIKPGAIVVFHDMEKAKVNVLLVLPMLLSLLKENGYETSAL